MWLILGDPGVVSQAGRKGANQNYLCKCEDFRSSHSAVRLPSTNHFVPFKNLSNALLHAVRIRHLETKTALHVWYTTCYLRVQFVHIFWAQPLIFLTEGPMRGKIMAWKTRLNSLSAVQMWPTKRQMQALLDCVDEIALDGLDGMEKCNISWLSCLLRKRLPGTGCSSC